MPFDPITEFDEAREKTAEQNKREFKPYTLEDIERMRYEKPQWQYAKAVARLYAPWGEVVP